MTTIVLTAAMLLAVVSASAAVINHTGSGTYNYPPLTAGGDSVYVYYPSTVNLLAGGSIGGHLGAYEHSWVNVSGGSIWSGLVARNNSTLTIVGSNFNFEYGDYTDGSLLDLQF